MADDEVLTPPDLPRSGPATPNRGTRRPPPTIEGTAEDVTPASEAPWTEQVPEAALPGEEALEERAADATVQEPSMAAGAADLAAAERPAEAAAAEGAADRVAADHVVEQGATESKSTPPASPGEPLDAPGPRRSILLPALGLLLVLLLGAVLYTLYNPPANDAVAGLANDVRGDSQRIAALEAKAGTPTDLKPLQDRLAALEAKPATAPDPKPLLDRLAALETATGQLRSDLDDLRGKVGQPDGGAAASTPASPDLAPVQAKLADLDGGLKSVQAVVAALPKIDLAPLDGKVADLGDKLTALQGAVAALPRVDLAPLGGRIDDLDRRLTPLEAQLAAPKAAEQVTAVRQNGSAAETRAAPLAVTAQAILQAIDDDRSFAPAVAALKHLGVDDATLAPLAAVADKGAPTRAEIRAGFDDKRSAMMGAGAPKPTGSVLDRMMASAQSLVKVRDAGASRGQDPDAVVARIDDDLQRRDDKAALGEWQGLPADGRAASQAWADTLKARVEAETAARGIVAGAITVLGSMQ